MQFRILTLLGITTLAALGIAIHKTCSHLLPDTAILASFAFLPFILLGFPMLVFSGLMALSIYLNRGFDFHRRDNWNNCLQMFVGGMVASAPFVYFFISFVIDNLT